MKERTAFDSWIAELNYEFAQVYASPDPVVPEHWRDDFEKGRTPHEAFDRIMMASAEAARRRRLS